MFRKTCVYIIVVAMSEPSKFREVQDLKYKGESVYVKTDAMEVSPIESSGSPMEMDDLNGPDLSSESEGPAPAPAAAPQESFNNLDQEMDVSQNSSPNTTTDSNSQIMESESTTNNTGGKRRTRKSNRKTKRANKKKRKSRTRR